jgi:chloride channel 7
MFAEDKDTAVTPVLVGAGAMLSSYCRLTYSLVVIMLETTSSINIFMPMMIGILTARAVGNLFTGSLYDRALRAKQMPFLRSSCPASSKNMFAKNFMATELVTLPSIANMESCKRALQSHHNAYPVLNTAGRLVGVMPKNMLVTLLEKKMFYDKESTDRSTLTADDRPADSPNLNEELLNASDSSNEEKPESLLAEFKLDYD